MTELRRLRASGGSAEPFAALFLDRMREAFAARKPDSLDGVRADYLICCGVHSQLLTIFPRMVAVYQNYLPFDSGPILRETVRMNGILAKELNERLFELANLGVLFGLERRRLGMEGGIEGASEALDLLRDAPVTAKTRLIWPFDPRQDKQYEMELLLVSPSGDRHSVKTPLR